MIPQPSDEDRKRRLQLALRRNEGKRLLPIFLDKLSSALQVNAFDLHLADLETTDKVWQYFTDTWHARHLSGHGIVTKTWDTEVLAEAKEYINQIERQTPDLPVFLFHPFLSEFCGALMTNSHQILTHAFDLMSLDDDDIMASSQDGESGIIISYSTQKDINYTHLVYRFTGFGKFSDSVN